jgi:hypothetical protein
MTPSRSLAWRRAWLVSWLARHGDTCAADPSFLSAYAEAVGIDARWCSRVLRRDLAGLERRRMAGSRKKPFRRLGLAGWWGLTEAGWNYADELENLELGKN